MEVAYRQAEDDCKRAEKEIAKLEEEAMKVMMGESAFSIDIIASMMPKHKQKLEEAVTHMQDLQRQIQDAAQAEKDDAQMFERLLSWADIFDKANTETKHMILCSLIDRVEVGRDYKISIHFKLTTEQYAGEGA